MGGLFAAPSSIWNRVKTNRCTLNISCTFTIRRCDPKRIGSYKVTHKTITSDPFKIPKYNLLKRKQVFFLSNAKLSFLKYQKSFFCNDKHNAIDEQNNITYKFTMVTFSSCTFPLLNLRNKYKMLQVKYSNNKSSAIFIDKGRNRFKYFPPYTLGKFAILNRFTFLGTLTF